MSPSFHEPDSSRLLTLPELLGHASRMRSARAVLAAFLNWGGRMLVPEWWKAKAPWYAGRWTELAGLAAAVDGSVFDPEDTYMAGLLALGSYEPVERYAVARYLPRDLPVVELGASMGVVSCLINRFMLHPERHVAVEANPALIPRLAAHRDRNRCQFQILNAAVAYGGDFIPFGISGSSVSGSLQISDRTTRVVNVPTTSLAAIVAANHMERCCLVCDIEGAEGALVRQEAETLQAHVHTIVMEVHPAFLGDAGVTTLSAELADRGFAQVWKKGDVWVLRRRSQA